MSSRVSAEFKSGKQTTRDLTTVALAITQVPGFPVQNFNKEFNRDELLFVLIKAKRKSAGPDQIVYPMLNKLPPIEKRKAVIGNIASFVKNFPGQHRESSI